MELWHGMALKLRFTTPMCGGRPRDDELVERWCELRKPSDPAHARLKSGIGPDGRRPRSMAEVVEQVAATTDVLPDEDQDSELRKVWVGFSKDDNGLFVPGGNLRAHIKACAETLGPIFKAGHVDGMKAVMNFKSKMTKVCYIQEDRIYLLNGDGQHVQEATGHRDATMQVMTALGPRTCLKRVDFVNPCALAATVMLLQGGEINRDHLVACLEYGKLQGFNQDRSLGFGRYDYELGE